MNHWQAVSRSEESWRYLLEELRPEIALLTEACPPAHLIEGGRAAWSKTIKRGGWGSAVYVAEGFELRHLPLEACHPGAFVAAEVEGPGLPGPITVVSLYGVFEKILGIDYCSTTLHRSISDLTCLLDDRSRRGRIVLGGDLNVSPAVPEWRDVHLPLFERIEQFGLESCFEYLEHPTPTWRTKQLDHVFVSRELIPRVSTSSVVEVGELSDHHALLVEVDARAALG